MSLHATDKAAVGIVGEEGGGVGPVSLIAADGLGGGLLLPPKHLPDLPGGKLSIQVLSDIGAQVVEAVAALLASASSYEVSRMKRVLIMVGRRRPLPGPQPGRLVAACSGPSAS